MKKGKKKKKEKVNRKIKKVDRSVDWKRMVKEIR